MRIKADICRIAQSLAYDAVLPSAEGEVITLRRFKGFQALNGPCDFFSKFAHVPPPFINATNGLFGIFTLRPAQITGKPSSSGRSMACPWIVAGSAQSSGATCAQVKTSQSSASISASVRG